jgi:hypothetical protein
MTQLKNVKISIEACTSLFPRAVVFPLHFHLPLFSSLGCDALFTNDYSFPKPKFNTKRTSDPETFGEERPAPPNVPSPMARWVSNALTGSCAKHSHKVR